MYMINSETVSSRLKLWNSKLFKSHLALSIAREKTAVSVQIEVWQHASTAIS
jgi:hypothetical protein